MSSLKSTSPQQWQSVQTAYDTLLSQYAWLQSIQLNDTAEALNPLWLTAPHREAERISEAARDILIGLNRLMPLHRDERKPAALVTNSSIASISLSDEISTAALPEQVTYVLGQMRTQFAELLRLERALISPLDPPVNYRRPLQIAAGIGGVLFAFLLITSLLREWPAGALRRGDEAFERAAALRFAASTAPEVTAEPGTETAVNPLDVYTTAFNEYRFAHTFFIVDYRPPSAAAGLERVCTVSVTAYLDEQANADARTRAAECAALLPDNSAVAALVITTYVRPARDLLTAGEYAAARALLNDLPAEEDGFLPEMAEQLYQTSLQTEALALRAAEPPDWAAIEPVVSELLNRRGGDRNRIAVDLAAERLLHQAANLLGDANRAAEWPSVRVSLAALEEPPLNASRSELRAQAVELLRRTDYQMFAAMVQAGQYAAARAAIDSFIAADPAHRRYQATEELLYTAYVQPVLTALDTADWEAAVALLEPMQRTFPVDRFTRDNLSRAYFELGIAAIAANDLAAAQTYLEATLAVDPTYTDLRDRLVTVYYDRATTALAADPPQWVTAQTHLLDLTAIRADYRDSQTLLRETYYAPLIDQLAQALDTGDAELCAEVRAGLEAELLVDYRETRHQINETYYCEIMAALAADDLPAARTAITALARRSQFFRDIEALYTQTYYEPAVAALESGDWATVRELIPPLLERTEFYQDAFVLLRESYYRPGAAALAAADWSTARRELTPLVLGVGEQPPIDPLYRDALDLLRQAYYLPGLHEYERREYRAARTHWEPLLIDTDDQAAIAPAYRDTAALYRRSFIEQAAAEFTAERWSVGRALLEQLRDFDPAYESALVTRLLGDSYYRPAVAALTTGEWAAARVQLTELLNRFSNYRDAEYLLRESYYRPAVIALNSANWESVRSLISSLREIDPDFRAPQVTTLLYQSHYRPAGAALTVNDWPTAQSEFAALTRLFPDDAEAARLLRESYYRAGTAALTAEDWTAAQSAFAALHQLDSGYAQPDAALAYAASYQQPGAAALAAGDWAAARDYYDDLLAIVDRLPLPDRGQVIADARAQHSETFYRPALAALTAEDWTTARALFAALDPTYRDTMDRLRDSYLLPVQQLIDSGNLGAARVALDLYRRSSIADPDQYRAVLLRTYNEGLRDAMLAEDWFSARVQYQQLSRQVGSAPAQAALVAEYPPLLAALRDFHRLGWSAGFTLAEPTPLPGDPGLLSIAPSAGGTWLLNADLSGRLTLLDSASAPLRWWTGRPYIHRIALDPRAQWAAAAGGSGVQIFDLVRAVPTHTLDTGSAWIADLAVAPDGSTLAAAGEEGNVRIWSAVDWAAPSRDLAFPSRILALTYLPDSSAVAVALADGAIEIRSTADSALLRRVLLPSLTRQMIAAPDGTLYILAETGTVLRLPPMADDAVTLPLTGLTTIALYGSGDLLAAAGPQQPIMLYDLPREQVIAVADTEAHTLVWTADGGDLIAIQPNGRALRWSVRSVAPADLADVRLEEGE